jgi:hypothetical protein
MVLPPPIGDEIVSHRLGADRTGVMVVLPPPIGDETLSHRLRAMTALLRAPKPRIKLRALRTPERRLRLVPLVRE